MILGSEFTEEQRFNQWWLYLILVAVAVLPLLFKPKSEVGLFIHVMFVCLLFAFFLMMKLETSIDKNGIRMRFFPFVKKEFQWSEIQKAKVVNYGFVGGWGIRLFTKYGTVYNIRGNKGLAIELENGKKFLIGTQKEEELQKFIIGLRV